MTSRDVRVPLGAVVRAHGLRGEVHVKPFNADSTLLGDRRSLVLRKDGQERIVTVRSVRRNVDAWLLTVDGVTTREGAEALRGHEVCVPRSELPPLPAGEWYLVDAIGLRVESPDGKSLGEVTDVVEYPAARCFAVRCEGGVREVPLREPYLVEVDVAGGRVVVDAFEDLELVAPREPKPARKRP